MGFTLRVRLRPAGGRAACRAGEIVREGRRGGEVRQGHEDRTDWSAPDLSGGRPAGHDGRGVGFFKDDRRNLHLFRDGGGAGRGEGDFRRGSPDGAGFVARQDCPEPCRVPQRGVGHAHGPALYSGSLRGKLAAVASTRRGGTTASLDGLYKYFEIAGMPVATSNYYNIIHGHVAVMLNSGRKARRNKFVN